MSKLALHVSPHPDDELLGAPASLMALRDAGYRVVNLACSLGRRDQRARREAELREACRLAGFELRLPAQPVAMSHREDAIDAEDRGAAYAALGELVAAAIAELRPALIVSPSPHDCHPAHELVGRVVCDVLEAQGQPAPQWWMWALWGAQPLPTLGVSFDAARLREILAALAMHGEELERNDYRRLVEGRALMYASLGPELLFGFGSVATPSPSYVELLTEAVLSEGRWLLGRRRWLDAAAPLAEPSDLDVGEWLHSTSIGGHFRPGAD